MAKISQEKIVEAFKLYKGIHSFKRFERSMSKMGFSLDCTRKHMALKHPAFPETIFLALTPSDKRAYLNNSHLVMRVLKKHNIA